VLADAGLREMYNFGSAGEAAGLSDGLKDSQLVQVNHNYQLCNI